MYVGQLTGKRLTTKPTKGIKIKVPFRNPSKLKEILFPTDQGSTTTERQKEKLLVNSGLSLNPGDSGDPPLDD